jgi:hypothetical protein
VWDEVDKADPYRRNGSAALDGDPALASLSVVGSADLTFLHQVPRAARTASIRKCRRIPDFGGKTAVGSVFPQFTPATSIKLYAINDLTPSSASAMIFMLVPLSAG